jgi:GalNAc-alpha-(1->4)-GalNAc-alpha-(1->3)-diNAcBac-PP-undecaprenol alpha-1,4-N-acetyl-D-galactosaminyltransferase
MSGGATDRGFARRIVIVVGCMGAGGAERVAATMANAWVGMGREVWLIATYLGTQVSSYALRPEISTVLLADALDKGSSFLLPVAARKAVALRRVVRRIGPDVVVSFLTNVNVLSIVALAGLGIPLIVSERTDPAGDIEMSRALRLARLLTYPFADCVVVQTAAAARRYAARLPGVSCIAVIRNPVPHELHASSARAIQPAAGGRVIAMGRLAASKGFGTLIEVFARVLGGDPGWRLEIWGQGPLLEELQQSIARLGVDKRIELCGATSRPWSVLAAAQIFMLPSAYEGFPNAMLEAMALGLPCIAFDCPSGPRELADGGAAARLVPAGDTEALARALRELASEPAARRALGVRAAAFVRENFAQEAIMQQWDAVIAQVRRGRPGAAAQATTGPMKGN